MASNMAVAIRPHNGPVAGVSSQDHKRRKTSHTPDDPTATSVPSPPRGEYTVGWICALACEMAVAKEMLDEVDEDALEQDPSDYNTYIFGRIGVHKVVIACLPAGIYGTNSAAVVARDMSRSFPSIRIGLMVGIGGGAPSPQNDIRLGDVVISQPAGKLGGVVQYDLGETVAYGKIQRTGSLNAPPRTLLSAVSRLKAKHLTGESQVDAFLSEMLMKTPTMRSTFIHQGIENDYLYEADHPHRERRRAPGTCQACDPHERVPRPSRENIHPKAHYGIIASGNQVMKDGPTRDRLRDELGALCFETEAAGLVQDFPCLVIRGIYSYADSHGNERWQHYAAATAAAYAKELLLAIPASQLLRERSISQVADLEPQDIARDHLRRSNEHLNGAEQQDKKERPRFLTDNEHSAPQRSRLAGALRPAKTKA